MEECAGGDQQRIMMQQIQLSEGTIHLLSQEIQRYKLELHSV